MNVERRKSHSNLDIEQKAKIIREVEHGRKQSDAAREFGLNPSTITVIMRKRDKIIQAWQEGATTSKCVKRPKFDTVDMALFEWFKQIRAKGLPISGTILAENAAEFATQLGFETFKASSGFIEKFKHRHGIVFKAVTGESNNADPAIASNWTANILPTIIGNYAASDIFNADETALFFKQLLPHHTLSKEIHAKAGKDRRTESHSY